MENNSWHPVLLEIMGLQRAFNDKVNGECWIDGITKDGRYIDWFRCIRQETAELVDCFNWKHWKDINKPTDFGNAQIELVDILHFITSQILVFQNEHDFDDLQMVDTWLDRQVNMDDVRVNDLELIEHLGSSTATMDIALVSDIFFMVCDRLGLTPEVARELYVGKNALNVFRQRNGYKDGTYVKMWSMPEGIQEDNEVLRGILKKAPETSFNDLLLILDIEYKVMLDERAKDSKED